MKGPRLDYCQHQTTVFYIPRTTILDEKSGEKHNDAEHVVVSDKETQDDNWPLKGSKYYKLFVRAYLLI